jgi:thioredoxin-related protein
MSKVLAFFIISILALAKVNWTEDVAKAIKLSKDKNLPIITIVTSKTCPSCRYMKRKVLSKENIYNFINTNFIPLKLDMKKYKKKLPTPFKGRGLPRFYFSDSNLEVYSKHIGGIREAKFMKILQKMKDK